MRTGLDRPTGARGLEYGYNSGGATEGLLRRGVMWLELGPQRVTGGHRGELGPWVAGVESGEGEQGCNGTVRWHVIRQGRTMVCVRPHGR